MLAAARPAGAAGDRRKTAAELRLSRLIEALTGPAGGRDHGKSLTGTLRMPDHTNPPVAGQRRSQCLL